MYIHFYDYLCNDRSRTKYQNANKSKVAHSIAILILLMVTVSSVILQQNNQNVIGKSTRTTFT